MTPKATRPGSGDDRTATRVFGAARPLDYGATRAFFDGRAARAGDRPVLTAVLYQDADPDLARRRDEAERDMVLAWLPAERRFRILDVACGIGRWGLHLADRAAAYQGIDFSEGLVHLARRSLAGIYAPGSYAVDVVSATDLAGDRLTIAPPFDLVVEAGLLLYLNDADAEDVLRRVAALVAVHGLVYVREPVATGERLTLDRHWSEELGQEYSATYRPLAFYDDLIDRVFLPRGFTVCRSVGLEAALGNRTETTQHFFLLERRQ